MGNSHQLLKPVPLPTSVRSQMTYTVREWTFLVFPCRWHCHCPPSTLTQCKQSIILHNTYIILIGKWRPPILILKSSYHNPISFVSFPISNADVRFFLNAITLICHHSTFTQMPESLPPTLLSCLSLAFLLLVASLSSSPSSSTFSATLAQVWFHSHPS